MPSLCRSCLTTFETGHRCPSCGSPQVVSHPELFDLSIAHMDCDAFYASVEKRDDPSLEGKPVIIGGGRRGVVSTACYVARIRGVRSAMPMFQALKLCPDAVVIKPRMDAYAQASRAIRKMMEELTPAIELLSLDEAFLDLSGTARLHGHPPAVMLAQLIKRMRNELGLTGSIGLSHNKFLAKVASDLEKPSGYSVIGKTETQAFLDDKPVGIIWGVGQTTKAALEAAGIHTIADLRRWPQQDLHTRFGRMGSRLYALARGEDTRDVSGRAEIKSISNETTFTVDTADPDILDGHLWRMAEKVSDRAKAKGLAGQSVTLKVKRHTHKTLTRRASLEQPTQLADRIYRTARRLFAQIETEGPFRLIGCGISNLQHADKAAPEGDDLLDRSMRQRHQAERATDQIRAKYGAKAIIKGRSLR